MKSENKQKSNFWHKLFMILIEKENEVIETILWILVMVIISFAYYVDSLGVLK